MGVLGHHICVCSLYTSVQPSNTMPAQGEKSHVSVITSNIMFCLAGDTAMTAAVRSKSVSTVNSLVKHRVAAVLD